MQRTRENLIIDLLAAVFFLGMMATGYLLLFPLPPGSNKSLSLWGLSRHQWGEVHSWLSLALLAILLTHLALHWKWIASMVRRQFHLATGGSGMHLLGAGLTLLIVAAGLSLFGWAAHLSVRELEDPCCPPASAAAPLSESPGASGVSSPEGSPAVDFWKEVYPILATSCLSCHGPKKTLGGFRVDQAAAYFGENGQPALVIPGSSANSPLIAIVSGARKDLPLLDRHRLPENKVLILKAWIDAGAKWPDQNGQE